MSTVTEDVIQMEMQKLCNKILDMQDIRFAGLISNSGNLYAGGFKKGIVPKISNERRRMMYMRFALESCFRNDFDDTLGGFVCSTIQREKTSIITFNICNYILLVFTEPRIDLQYMTKEIQSIIENNKRNFLNQLLQKM